MRVVYAGKVQGVGFRYTVKSLVPGYELTGVVRNLLDGRVELTVEGERAELAAFRQAIGDSGLGSLIWNEEVTWGPATGEFRGFAIVG